MFRFVLPLLLLTVAGTSAPARAASVVAYGDPESTLTVSAPAWTFELDEAIPSRPFFRRLHEATWATWTGRIQASFVYSVGVWDGYGDLQIGTADLVKASEEAFRSPVTLANWRPVVAGIRTITLKDRIEVRPARGNGDVKELLGRLREASVLQEGQAAIIVTGRSLDEGHDAWVRPLVMVVELDLLKGRAPVIPVDASEPE